MKNNLRTVLKNLFGQHGLSNQEAGFITSVAKTLNKKDNLFMERILQICSSSLGFKKDSFLIQIRVLVVRNIYVWYDKIYSGLAGKYYNELSIPCGCKIVGKSCELPIVEVDFVSEKHLWGETPRGVKYTRRLLELKTGDVIFSGKNEDGRYSYTVLRQHGHFPYHDC